jgi:L-ascorbate metabolism protein UlaG (beta-lactamase superfamily)
MKVTKYEHACLVIEKGDETLVIDPGAFTMPLTDVGGVVAVVITHEHADHWTAEQLERILDRNPDAKVFGPPGVAAAATGITVDSVVGGDEREVGGFRLAFTGGKHAQVHESIPIVDNVGVIVDDLLYYPGDSFDLPGTEVAVLAVPSSGPWLKTGEAMDFIAAVKPRRAFPVHDAVLSVIGKGMVNGRLEAIGKPNGTEFFVLEAGESTDL